MSPVLAGRFLLFILSSSYFTVPPEKSDTCSFDDYQKHLMLDGRSLTQNSTDYFHVCKIIEEKTQVFRDRK